MTLLHLVSQQTMQNLLPLLAMRPSLVIQVRSSDERFRQAAEDLKAAVIAMRKQPGFHDLNPEFRDWDIGEATPGVDSSRRAVGEALAPWPQAVVNLTGGTKPMAIGAFLAAQSEGRPVLYCDTHQRRFTSMNDRQPLPSLPAFDDVATTLNVETVMAAHGIPISHWKFQTASAALTEFGRIAFELHIHHRSAFRDKLPASGKTYGESLRAHFRSENGSVPSKRSALQSLLESPLPTPPSEPVLAFLKAAESAGLLQRNHQGEFLPGCQPTRGDVQRVANLLGGSWLELYTLDLLQRAHPRFLDPHWSVEPSGSAEASFGETDLVCVDTAHAALRIISCKTSPKQALEHLTALSQRRRDLGGSHAKATLAVLEAGNNQPEQFEKWGRLLNVEVLVGTEIARRLSQP
ncbi:MAG: DUF1887 family protein [Verrucomicrobiae bacterium]|nr:DUF1887 family protein [Verrucomicrobiae bacterium]